jgi:uncharacterized protein (TIGR03118 family)
MRRSTVATVLVAVFVSYLGTPAAVRTKTGGFVETDLVVNKSPLTDKNGHVHMVPATQVDAHLQNPWGLTSRPGSPTQAGSPFWVSDNNAGVATLYNVPGNQNSVSINPLVVSIPAPGTQNAGNGGTPTGAVFNIDSGGFKIAGVDKNGVATSASAVFLFATEDGTIVGWNPGVGSSTSSFNANGTSTQGIIAVDNSHVTFPQRPGAVYKGLAIATDPTGHTQLYATNFREGRVEVYDPNFATGSFFTDPNLPPSYAPFNIALIGSELFVTFAVQDAAMHDDVAGQGHGIVDRFDLGGQFPRRFADHGQLNSPWGMAVAPANFGDLGGSLWIGNFGDGNINAFDLVSGKSLGQVRDTNAKPIVIDGLWSLQVGNGGNGGRTDTLYFTAGPNDEKDGLFGSLSPH